MGPGCDSHWDFWWSLTSLVVIIHVRQPSTNELLWSLVCICEMFFHSLSVLPFHVIFFSNRLKTYLFWCAVPNIQHPCGACALMLSFVNFSHSFVYLPSVRLVGWFALKSNSSICKWWRLEVNPCKIAPVLQKKTRFADRHVQTLEWAVHDVNRRHFWHNNKKIECKDDIDLFVLSVQFIGTRLQVVCWFRQSILGVKSYQRCAYCYIQALFLSVSFLLSLIRLVFWIIKPCCSSAVQHSCWHL